MDRRSGAFGFTDPGEIRVWMGDQTSRQFVGETMTGAEVVGPFGGDTRRAVTDTCLGVPHA